MNLIQDAIDAAKIQDWYAVASLVLALAIQILRKQPHLRELIWSRIPDGLRFLIPLVGGAVTAYVAAYMNGAGLVDALNAAVGGALTIGLGSAGTAAILRDSPLPWDGGSGGKPKPPKKLGDDDDTPPTGTKPVGLTTLAIALLVQGCGLFGSESRETCGARAAIEAKIRCDARGLDRCGAYEDDPSACPDADEVDEFCEKVAGEELAKCN